MKKEERKTLEKKIHGAVLEIVKNEKLLRKDKIEKTIKKSVKQLLKKLSKNTKNESHAEKKKIKTVEKSPKKNPLTATYKKIKVKETSTPKL